MARIPAGALTTGRLAASAGVSADSIRHYEKLGLLAKPLRTASGYRLYTAECVARVAIIRSAVKAGFSLRELAGIFKERDAGGAPCRRVADLASEKIAALENRILELTQLRDWLSSTVNTWEKRLRQTRPGKQARLLESLNHQPAAPLKRKQQ